MKKVSKIAATAIAFLMVVACKKKGDEISVYPNPASDYVVFDATTNAEKHKNGEIVVKDFVGEIIATFYTNDSSRIQWNVDTFQRGVYLYTYTADKMRPQSGKIVLE